MLFCKKTLKDIDFNNKVVLVRLDLNVPIKDGEINDTKRIDASLPTIQYLLDHHAKVVILSHLGRIKTASDITSNQKTLAPIAKYLQTLLPNHKVHFANNNIDDHLKTTINNLKAGKDLLLLENTRYQDFDLSTNTLTKKESKCDEHLSAFWASLGDVFVNDAFATAHRKHASNYGIASQIKESCIGFLIENELSNLKRVCENQTHPFVAIIGGAKVSDKIKIIKRLLLIADYVLIGGGMAYTFLKSQGYDIGKSLVEEDMIPVAKELLALGKSKIVLSQDFYCNLNFEDTPGKLISIKEGLKDYEGLDIGDNSIKNFLDHLDGAKTVLWNGPVGVFEFKNYQKGTKAICEKLKQLRKHGCFTVIGGGDSASATKKLGFLTTDFSFVSTGGGASLALVEGSPLPGIDAISDC